MSRTVIISIEGNIGAGKSTLLFRLQQLSYRIKPHQTIEFVTEPVERWSVDFPHTSGVGKITNNEGRRPELFGDVESDNILSHYYADPDKYAFPFQIMAYTTQTDELYKSIKKEPAIVLSERSLESNHEIFTKMLHNEGKIDTIHYKIYCENADTCRRLCPHPITTDAVIYLRTRPEVCAERVQKRGREGEDLITLDYLKNCHEYHDNWLGKMPAEQCLVLDANEDILYWHLCEILDFMDGVAKRIHDNQVDVNEIRRADIFGW